MRECVCASVGARVWVRECVCASVGARVWVRECGCASVRVRVCVRDKYIVKPPFASVRFPGRIVNKTWFPACHPIRYRLFIVQLTNADR